MVQLFKDVFKGKRSEADKVEKAEPVQGSEPKVELASNAAADVKKKPKHGEDGVCCGGCS